jgi:UDP-3-O-[3-hydroxymyristoyl] glucosamine N-acyltransferase
MKKSIDDIVKDLACDCKVIGNRNNVGTGFSSIYDAKDGSITWLRAQGLQALEILNSTPSNIIVCQEFDVPLSLQKQKTFLFVDNPHLRYLRLMKRQYEGFFDISPGIHHSAIVSPKAKIGDQVYIGPFAIVGACTLGDYSVVKSHATICSGVETGRRVLISEYCNIGGQGFGYIKNELDEYENMYHIGGVLLEDDVHVFPYTNIDQGTLSRTIVGAGSKIDHFCHIGHNSRVGKNNIITANVTFTGGVRTGDECFVGCGSIIRDNTVIGKNVTVGMCSSVTKNIPDNQTWLGSPAREIDEFKLLQRQIGNMLKINERL